MIGTGGGAEAETGETERDTVTEVIGGTDLGTATETETGGIAAETGTGGTGQDSGGKLGTVDLEASVILDFGSRNTFTHTVVNTFYFQYFFLLVPKLFLFNLFIVAGGTKSDQS